MSINLDLQNWPDASSLQPQPSSAPYQVIMNRSAADKTKNADDDLWNRSCLKKLSNTCTQEEQQQGSTIKSSQPVFTSEEHQMLSFSASSHKVIPHLPYFYNNYASHYNNPNFTGYTNYCGGGGATNMHDLINGPFTPSQWTELEHQALIYKHITSNMPVPSTLLMPIRRALSHAAFSRYNSGHFSSMGWGGFHLGLQNSNDPEPGRCRRTDGKKWRCSRDAVVDQKYCERHINRGRHRSRKPVEGQSRYSVGKLVPASSNALAANLGNESNGLIPEKLKISHNEKNLHLGTSDESVHNSRSSCDGRVQVDSHNLLVPPPSLMLHPRASLYNIHNSKPAACYGQLFGSDFGLVSSDALKNPSGQSIIHSKSYEDKNVINKQIRPHSTPIHQFIDDCPENLPDHISTTWPNLDDDTQLSISIPTAYHHVKDSSSPLTLASEFDSVPMGLELGGSKNTDEQSESEDKYPNWIPISIIGGPLGEVLQCSSVTNTAITENRSPGLNLMTDVRWDKGPRFTSSPTGVLQKETAFASRTNSSAGNSPRAENSMAATF